MASHILNDVDRVICDILQKNGRAHFNELAEIVHLSVPAVSERVRKLEERGIIKGYFAKLQPDAFGLNIAAFILVTVEGSHNYKKFLDNCTKEPEIMECHAVTGDASHLVKIRTTSPGSLEQLLSRMQEWSGVKKTLTNIILSTHHESLSIDTGTKPSTLALANGKTKHS
ncbi:MAG: Lrp/AsnC family transcriptional regulator [Candidatus Kapaibacteriota bacterium]|jgi:Lrp/AsnC family leucine-responsive transcriptional regulator